MAGAGPVSETLPVVNVSSMLTEGERFLKWEDQDVNCIPYTLQVDPKGHVLFWKPEDYSKDTEVLDLVHIRDVRTGQYAKVPKAQGVREAMRLFVADDEDANALQERTITVVYGPNFVDVSFINFVTRRSEQAQKWTDALFKCTNNLLEFNSSPLKSLERFFTRIYVQEDQEGEVPAKLLVKHFVNNKDDKKRAYQTLQSAGLASGKKDSIKVKDFTFDKFLEFYNRFVTRHDLDGVFAELGAKNKPYLTTDQLVTFLNQQQRDPRLNEILYPYYNESSAIQIINTHEPNRALAGKGNISIDGLTKYLMSDDNYIILPAKLQIHQDLTCPLPHYFINSSHNTYLTGHQLTGKSSVEIYRQVLLAGCRCIELDCWDGKTDDQEPMITHGMTLCTEVPFKDVIEAITETAFKTSDYPVILSFENHCSAKQQEKMASYCVQIFGDLLLNKELEDYPLEPNVIIPSPKVLKRKILIKNKKRVNKAAAAAAANEAKNPTQSPDEKQPPATPTESDVNPENNGEAEKGEGVGEDDEEEEGPVDAEGKVVVPKSEEEEEPEVEAQQELSELVNYFQPVHFRGFDYAERIKHYYEMSSFSENAAMNLLKEMPVDFVNYNKFQPSRIYPKGSRVSSDNYMPQLFWNAGCQLVALNFQTLDLPMQLNLGKFEINGRCGFLLKPEHMRRHDRTFDPFVEQTVDGIIAGTVEVKVISGQCLLERRASTYVEVEMYGLPEDTVRRKYRTKVVSNNTLNPVYDEEEFKFKVILPQLAELRIVVYEDNGKMIGHRVLPVDALSPGYRHIKLRNEAYQPLCLPTLFVHIITKDYVPEGFTNLIDALSNPMKYLSEKEKRSHQLEALEDLEEDSVFTPGTADLSLPEMNKASAIPRGSIVSVQTIINQDSRKDQNRRGESLKNKPIAEKPSNRSQSVKVVSSTKPPMALADRSISETGEKIVKENETPNITVPTVDTIKLHKAFVKFEQKIDGEYLILAQKQAKERSRINKELEVDTKKLNSVVEKEKSVHQKKHAKLLKKSQQDGAYNEVYKDCLDEINQLNARHKEEVDRLMREQRGKVKHQYTTFYQEQIDFLKSKVEPRIAEMKKILSLTEVNEKKRLEEKHAGDMLTLKKHQDSFNRGQMKELAKQYTDKSELQKMKRQRNNKHIEQSVTERQKLKEIQEKDLQYLTQKFEEQMAVFDNCYETELKSLDELFQTKSSQLDTQDLRLLIPLLKDTS